LSAEELKQFFAKEEARTLARKVMCEDERVFVDDKTFVTLP
jgi:hypothetical protein